MPEKILYDPIAWLFVKLFAGFVFLLVAFGAYEHRRITDQGAKVDEFDKARQKNCMTINQCLSNRESSKDMLDKIYEGQSKIHERIDKMYEMASKRRKGDD